MSIALIVLAITAGATSLAGAPDTPARDHDASFNKELETYRESGDLQAKRDHVWGLIAQLRGVQDGRFSNRGSVKVRSFQCRF